MDMNAPQDVLSVSGYQCTTRYEALPTEDNRRYREVYVRTILVNQNSLLNVYSDSLLGNENVHLG